MNTEKTQARVSGTFDPIVGRVVVNVEFVAKTIGERLYALLAFSGLGLAVAILGRAGATLKGGEEVRITVTHETANSALDRNDPSNTDT